MAGGDGLLERLSALRARLDDYGDHDRLDCCRVRGWLDEVLEPPLQDGWWEYVAGHTVVSMRRGGGNWFVGGCYDPAVVDADMRRRRARFVGASEVGPGLSP